MDIIVIIVDAISAIKENSNEKAILIFRNGNTYKLLMFTTDSSTVFGG
jgi:hypothetical protein